LQPSQPISTTRPHQSDIQPNPQNSGPSSSLVACGVAVEPPVDQRYPTPDVSCPSSASNLASRLQEPSREEIGEQLKRHFHQQVAPRVRNVPGVQFARGRPVCRATVRPEQVQRVLQEMGLDHLMPAQGPQISHHIRTIEDFYSSVEVDESFDTGARPSSAGLQQMAAHYKSRDGADIVFHDVPPDGEIGDVMIGLLAEDRELPGENVRRAHHFVDPNVGTEGHHSIVVFVREGGQEALFAVDSIAGGSLEVGRSMVEKTEWCLRPIPIYELTLGLQRDRESCMTFSLKAADILTGRHSDGHGGFGDYFITGLIDELERSKLEMPDTLHLMPYTYIKPVWAPPEIAVLGQLWQSMLAHLDSDLDMPLRGRKVGSSPRERARRFVHEMESTFRTPGVVVAKKEIVSIRLLDYLRQKGERRAEALERDLWVQLIEANAAQAESPPLAAAQRAHLVRRLKEVVSEPLPPLDLENMAQRIAELPQRTFINEASDLMRTLGELQDEWMSQVESNSGLLNLLTESGWKELEEAMGKFATSWTQLSVELKARIGSVKEMEYVSQQRDRVESFERNEMSDIEDRIGYSEKGIEWLKHAKPKALDE
jgi:hypothetical protein